MVGLATPASIENLLNLGEAHAANLGKERGRCGGGTRLVLLGKGVRKTVSVGESVTVA